MKILLYNLGWPERVSRKTFKLHFAYPPLDLLLLRGEAVRAGAECRILDGFIAGTRSLQESASWADWIIVTTTPYHMWQCPNSDWEWIKGFLAQLPQRKVVLCGLHSSIFPEQTLRETGVHAVIHREPEPTLREFLNNTTNWHETAGVAYLNKEEFVPAPSITPIPLDELVADYRQVEIKRYSYPLIGRNTGIFESSRGCPWKCNFCNQEMYSWTYRTKSPTVFAKEVATALKCVPMKTAYFFDLEFTIQTERTLAICEALIERGIQKQLSWCCQTRADMVDKEMLRAMRSAGCKLIHFGVESGSPEILKATNKKITLEKIEAGIALAKEHGFQTACFFMFGLPNETPEQFDNTLRFAKKINPTYASFHFAIPFPGTPLYSQFITERNLPWGSWPSLYFDGWSHDQIAGYLKSAVRKFYLHPDLKEPKELFRRASRLPAALPYFRSLAG